MRALAWRLRRLLAALEIHPLRTAQALVALPRFVSDWWRFSRMTDRPMVPYPCLQDRKASASVLGEYFWQDLYVARRILEARPRRHVDIGSRIDGFVAHLACQREVEVYDIRPLDARIPNLRFRQWDLTDGGPAAPAEQSDSVSCLHTLEHVGLGRYGDPLAVDGWHVALGRLAGLVAPGGQLWLSVPVGRRRVEFNAHRVFDPREILERAGLAGLACAEFLLVDGPAMPRPVEGEAAIAAVAQLEDALGLFRFERPSAS
jgi:Caenorhabditis protein of unknown function, DUF268